MPNLINLESVTKAYGPTLVLDEVSLGVAEGERSFSPHVIVLYQLFPNSLLIWQIDHVEIWRAFPGRDDPSRADVEMTIYRPAVTTRPDSYWEKNRDVAIRTVLETQVETLRKRGVSWAEIGAALGVSRQAVWERFS